MTYTDYSLRAETEQELVTALVAAFASLFPNISTEGSVVMSIESAVPSGSTPTLMIPFSLVNTANVNNNRFILEHTTAGNGNWRAFSNGVTTVSALISGALQQNVVTKRGFSFKNADYVVAADGAITATQSFGAMPVGLNQMGIGHLASVGYEWFGWFRKLIVYDLALPDSQLQVLTQ